MTFRIQHGEARAWRRVVDTGLESPEDTVEPHAAPYLSALEYAVKGRSVVVLMKQGVAPLEAGASGVRPEAIGPGGPCTEER
jgi:glycogen operon protein